MPTEALLFMISEELRDNWMKEFMASLYYYHRRPSIALMLRLSFVITMILNNDAFHLGLESWRKQYNAM